MLSFSFLQKFCILVFTVPCEKALEENLLSDSGLLLLIFWNPKDRRDFKRVEWVTHFFYYLYGSAGFHIYKYEHIL